MNTQIYALKKMFLEYLQIEKNYSPYTIEFYDQDIIQFVGFMNSASISTLEEVSAIEVRLFLTELYEKKLARKSIARKISSLRSFYRFLMREKIVEENPFFSTSIPKLEKRLPTFFFEEEIEQLFIACNTETPLGRRNEALLELLYATGMRVGECTNLMLKDIDFHTSTVLVRGKGKKERYIPFGNFASTSLFTYIKESRPQLLRENNNDHGFLFVNYRGGVLSQRGVRTILTKLMEQSAVRNKIHPHKLRHTFATHLMANGADIRTVQELLGHAFLSSTQLYTHVTNDYLKKTYMSFHPRA